MLNFAVNNNTHTRMDYRNLPIKYPNSTAKNSNPYFRKRKFTELDIDSSINENIEKGISMLTITKRYKVSGSMENSKYIQNDYQIPESQFLNLKIDKKESNSFSIVADEIVENMKEDREEVGDNDYKERDETSSTKKLQVNMELEKMKVEHFYRNKNKLLLQAMFEN